MMKYQGVRRSMLSTLGWMAIVVFVLSMVPSCKASCFFAAWNGANGNAWFGPNGGKSSLWPFTQIMRPPPSNIHVLILPGFGNEAFDYTKEGSIIDSLQKRNWKREQLHVVPLNRFDWLLVFAKGLWDEEFRNGQADPTRPAFGWYLNRVATEIDKIVQQQDKAAGDSDDNKKERQIILLGHSAGGWLARAALGFYGVDNDDDDDEEEEDDASPPSARDSLPTIPLDRILGVVTLGAPNQPPPQHVMDMTRGAFTTTCQLFPSASYFTNRNIFYMTVTGNAVEGEYQARSSFLEPSTTKGFAYESYKTVCGTGETMGDGVVPTCSAHVDDAVQVDLEGVFHSINEPTRWYGADAILDQWHDTMLQLIQKTMQQQGQPSSPDNNNNMSITQLGDLLRSFQK